MAQTIFMIKKRRKRIAMKSSVPGKDDRMERIMQQLIALSKLDLDVRGKISEKGDELDAITAGLNTLGEELSFRIDFIKHNEQRINIILEILMKYNLMDFSQKAVLGKKGDEIDALSAGLNTLGEELAYSIESQNKYTSELEETNHKLEESEARYHLLVDEVLDYSIVRLDPNGLITTWNKGAEKIKQYKEEEVLGKHFSVFYTEEDVKKGLPEISLAEAKKEGRHIQTGWRIRKDKSVFWADIVTTALKDKKGKITGFVKITRDLTERKKTEIELKNKSLELERSNTELEQFAYVASHDLQEPLRMVNSYVQLLANRYKDKLDEDANDFINFAIDGSNRMRILINSLLEYSRINRVKPFETVHTNEVLKEVLVDLAGSIKENKAKITYTDLPEISGDSVLIGQVFQNLISNAIKFKGENAPIITISAKKRNGEFIFSVKDNGIGIKKEYAEKIFVIFQRLHGKHVYPGTGIGLAICKKIVERHGGKIWVESEPGKGSEFCFTLA